MLDDLKLINDRDPKDALGIVERQTRQLQTRFEVAQTPVQATNIVYSGMGGSALAALFSTSWPMHKIPFTIVRDYVLPPFVSEKTYFIASSYSGNTEETLSTLQEAEKRGATIAAITSGGKLAEIARDKNYPLIILPPVEQPRYSALQSFKALLTLLDKAQLLITPDYQIELDQASDFLSQVSQSWLAIVPTIKNQAKQLALEVIGKSVVIYAGPKLWPAAYKWKIDFNENAKHLAWANQLPEFNHNELTGWAKQPVDKPYAVIDLRSNLEHPQIQKRFELSAKLLSGKRPESLVVNAQGNTLLEQLLWTATLGDFVSVYAAILNGVEPVAGELAEKFKKALANS